MITGQLWDLLDDNSLKKIDTAAIGLLTKTGVRIHHEGLLDIMGTAGCRIDKDAMRCYFTEQHVRDVLAHYGHQEHQTGKIDIPSGWSPQMHMGYGGSYPHLLDWPSGKRRLATKQDCIDIWKMGHALPEFGGLSKVLTCCQVDQRIEPLWAAVQMAEITDKAFGGGEIFYAEYIQPLVEMSEVMGGPGDTRFVNSCDFWISPLIWDRSQAEVFLEKRRIGKEVNPGTMVISGLSGPVTVAGTAAIGTAELMAGLCFGHAVNPDLPGGVGIATGSIDLRTMNALFGSPEANLQDATIQQLFRRLYGIRGWVACGYVDCKRPGIEATFQKMMSMGLQACGLHAGLGGGLLSAGQDYCPVQHFLDDEIGKALERLNGHFDVDDDSLALDLIHEIATGDHTDFLQTDHTLNHYRDVQWYPKWFDRSLWQGTEVETSAERKMLERIDEHCKAAIARYEKPDVDESKVTELKKIYATTEKQLLN